MAVAWRRPLMRLATSGMPCCVLTCLAATQPTHFQICFNAGYSRPSSTFTSNGDMQGSVKTGVQDIASRFEQLVYVGGTLEWASCSTRALEGVESLAPESVLRILKSCAHGRHLDLELFNALTQKLLACKTDLVSYPPESTAGLLKSLGVIGNNLKRMRQVEDGKHAVFLENCRQIVAFLVDENLTTDVFLHDSCMVSTHSEAVHGLGLLCAAQACEMNPDARQLVGAILGEIWRRGHLPSLSLPELSHIFYACAAMTYKHFGIFQSICEVVEAKLKTEGASNISGQSSELGDTKGVQVFPKTGTARMLGDVVTHIMWAMGTLHFRVESTLEVVMQHLERSINGLNSEQVALCFDGLYKLDHWPGEIVESLALRASTRSVMRGFLDEELAMVLKVIAQFSYRDAGVLDCIWSEISHPNRLEHIQNDILLSIMDSFWRLRYRKPSVWRVFGNELMVTSRSAKLSNADIGSLMLAFGKAGHLHDPLLGAISIELCHKDRLVDFEDCDLINVLYGLALVGSCDHALLNAFAAEVSKILRLGQFSEDHLSSVVYSFSRLKFKNKALFDELAWEICKVERLKEFSEHSLSIILWGFAKVQYFNKGVVDSIIAEATSAERLPSYTSQGLTNIVYSLGRLNYWDHQVLVLLGKEVSRLERLEQFTSQAISNIAFAFGKLEFPFVPFMKGLDIELSKCGRIQGFNELELSNLMYGLGQMRFSFPKAIEAMEMEVSKESRLRRFTCPDLCNLAFGFSGIRYYVAPALDAFVKEVMKPERMKGFSDSELQAITVKLDDLLVVSSDVLDYLAKELTVRCDESQDWDYPIFRPWKGEWFFQPPYPQEEDATEEEVDQLLREFARYQQKQESKQENKRPRWTNIKV